MLTSSWRQQNFLMHSHSWSLVVTRGHSWSTRGHSWSLVVIRGHSWSLVVTRVYFRHDRFNYSTALIFEIRDTELFTIKRCIKINSRPFASENQTRSIFCSRKGKLILKHASEEPRYILKGTKLTELHVFQKLRESHNMKKRAIIKINISIQIYNQKCNLLYHGFPTKSTAWVMFCNGRYLFKTTICSQRIISSLIVLSIS